MNSNYSDNPFDNIYASPSASAGPQPVRPIPQANGPGAKNELDDLLNPFAVLGLENKPIAVVNKAPIVMSPTSQQQQQWGGNVNQPTGAGWTSPAQPPPPQFAIASPQPQQQQQQQWASPHSAFQPPTQQQQPYALATSPAFGVTSPAFSSASPALYGAPSPAYGTYSPASPAFASGPAFQPSPQQQQQGADALGFQSPQAAAYGSSGLSKPGVTEADLSLFAAPIVVATKSAPKANQAQSPASASADKSGGWAPTVTPSSNDGWDNDDFGISWEQPKKLEPKVEEEVKASPRAEPVASHQRQAAEPTVAGDHKMEGNVLARVSVRTLIVKEWKQTFWIITGGKLLLYRSKEDYLYNPVGVMVKKDVPLRDNLRCSEVTCKPYKGYGDLYHFTLEEMLDYGPSLIAKFASTDVKAIRELRAVIITHIIAERKRRVGHHNGMRSPPPPPSASESDHHREHASATPPRSRTPEAGHDGDDKYSKWGHI